RQVVWVEDAQQCISDLWELVVDLVMDTPGEKGERLDQALNVGILAPVCFKQQATGDLGVFDGKFCPDLPQPAQLTLIVCEEIIRHQSCPCTTYSWVFSRKTASNVTGSGAGSIRSSASIRKRKVRSCSRGGSRVTRTRSNLGSNVATACSRARRIRLRSFVL